jgi:hypothetical protein
MCPCPLAVHMAAAPGVEFETTKGKVERMLQAQVLRDPYVNPVLKATDVSAFRKAANEEEVVLCWPAAPSCPPRHTAREVQKPPQKPPPPAPQPRHPGETPANDGAENNGWGPGRGGANAGPCGRHSPTQHAGWWVACSWSDGRR